MRYTRIIEPSISNEQCYLQTCWTTAVWGQRQRTVYASTRKSGRLLYKNISRPNPARKCLVHRCKSGPPSSEQVPEEPDENSDTPDLMMGINWFCYSALGLLFLTDFTPLGAAIRGSGTPGVALAVLQWGAFVLPTLWLCRQRGYSLSRTFKLNRCSLGRVVAATAGGAALFAVATTLVQLRVGAEWALGGDTSASVSDWAAAGEGLGLGMGAAGESTAASVLLYVLSPAVAEELLFRGFLLTGLRRGLGSVDSVAVSGALFAAMHLSVEQFFQYSLLGFACGAVCVRTESLLPPVALHAGYNLAAVLLALATT